MCWFPTSDAQEDGYTLIKTVRQRETESGSWPHCARDGATAYARAETARKRWPLGFQEYAVKPYRTGASGLSGCATRRARRIGARI
jgi:hypothetical protein